MQDLALFAGSLLDIISPERPQRSSLAEENNVLFSFLLQLLRHDPRARMSLESIMKHYWVVQYLETAV